MTQYLFQVRYTLGHHLRLVNLDIARRSFFECRPGLSKSPGRSSLSWAEAACLLDLLSFGFLVECLSVRSRASVNRGPFDNDPIVSAATDVEVIAGADRSTRLGTGSVERDFAARDSGSGQRTCFEKTRRPKPVVDSELSRGFLGTLLVHGTRSGHTKLGRVLFSSTR